MPVWNSHGREACPCLVEGLSIHLYPSPLEHSLCVRSPFLLIKLYRIGAIILTYLQRTLRHNKVKSTSKALKAGERQSQTQSRVHVPMCPTLCDAMDCPWDFAGKNTGVDAISSSRGSSWPRGWTRISCVSCFEHNAYNYSGSPPPLYPKCPHQLLFPNKNVEIWLFQHSLVHSICSFN